MNTGTIMKLRASGTLVQVVAVDSVNIRVRPWDAVNACTYGPTTNVPRRLVAALLEALS